MNKNFDESGWFLYENRITMQNRNFEGPFMEFFLANEKLRIIEIGAAYGGFTSFLTKMRVKNIIHSIDVIDIYSRPELLEVVRLHNIPTHFADAHTRECQRYVNMVIARHDTPVAIMCDGGSKVHEFNLYTPLLRSGDFIFAHDYSPNKEYFENNMKNINWNWHEIQDSDVQEISEKYNLEQQYKQPFLDIAWLCKKKI
jgi:hypothetical protein